MGRRRLANRVVVEGFLAPPTRDGATTQLAQPAVHAHDDTERRLGVHYATPS